MQQDLAPAFTGTRRYSIERELGSGGMGVVYEAVDLERNARIALKALSQRDALNIYRLKNEFRQLADLSHPNLVALHELCCENGSWFFTMELVDGVPFDLYVCETRVSSLPPAGDPRGIATVAGRIVRDVTTTLGQRAIGSEYQLPRPTCNVRRLRRVLRQLVEAVAALHNAGKLHRDIKPSNVLVTPQERVVVLDFGLVSNSTLVEPEQDAAERTVGGCVFGTPAYMSPEQAAGEQVTTASDWYAVGVMLYETLTGQLPFDGTVLDILRQKEELEASPPSSIVTGIPEDLDDLCRDLLRRDPKRRPSGAEILRRVTGHTSAPMLFDAQSTTAMPKGELFIGRETHLAALRDAFETAKAGKPVTVLVQGFSGMGKSALVRCFANELIQRGEAVVLRGRCYERESVPYKAFDNIIDALSRYLMRLPAEQAAELLPRNVHSLARLFPVLRRVKAIAHARASKHQPLDAREIRNHGFAALKELLLRITDFQPLVLNIDDLQWADMDSARLLAFLLSRPDPPPLLLVGTYRRDEVQNSPFLRYVLNEAGLDDGASSLREIAVDALDAREAHALCAQLLADLPTTHALAAESIGAESEGVPFFITELVQHVRGRVERGDLSPSVGALSLKDVVLDRVRSLPRDAQRLLEALSVAGGPIEQAVALHAAALSGGDRSALLSLRAARLIRTRGTRQTDAAEVYHDRVRETVVAAMHPEARRLMHARIASAIESFGISDPERLVAHYSGAGDGVRAGETAVQAAHGAAQKLAFSRAAELFRAAIELHAKDDRLQGELHHHLGEALANAGRGAQAAEAYLVAADRAESSERPKLIRLAAQQYLRSGHSEQGTALARELFQAVGLRLPETVAESMLTYVWHKTALSLTGFRLPPPHQPDPVTAERLALLDATCREIAVMDPARGAALQAQFVRHAQKAGDRQRFMTGLAWEAWNVALTQGDAVAAERILARVRSLAADLGTPYARATLQSAVAGCALLLGRVGEVLEPATEAERTYREHCAGTNWEQTMAATYRYAAIEHVGGFPTILDETPQRTRDTMERNDLFGTAFLTLFVAFAELVGDRPLRAQEFLAAQAARLSAPYSPFHLWVAVRSVHTALYLGDGACALTRIEQELPLWESSALSRGRFFRSMNEFLLARASLMVAKSHPERAASLARRAAEIGKRLVRNGQPHAKGLGLLVQGEAAHRLGDTARAMQKLTECMNGTSEHQAPMLATYARRAIGMLRDDAEGALLIAEADAALGTEGVVCPERWAQIWVSI